MFKDTAGVLGSAFFEKIEIKKARSQIDSGLLVALVSGRDGFRLFAGFDFKVRGDPVAKVHRPAVQRFIRDAAGRPRVADGERPAKDGGAFFFRLVAGGFDPRDEIFNRGLARQGDSYR